MEDGMKRFSSDLLLDCIPMVNSCACTLSLFCGPSIRMSKNLKKC